MNMLTPSRRIRPIVPLGMALLPALGYLAVIPVTAQEKSVRPGINKSFQDPNVGSFVERFEKEGREVYDLREEIVKRCGVTEGAAVADVGSGTGLFTRLFAKAVGTQGRVYAVDISQKFLDHVEKTSRAQKLSNVVAVLCTAESPKLPPHSVDLVFICDTYHHFEYPQKTMSGIWQALRPDGRLVMIDFERIKGVSSEWIMGHVRAGKEVFRKEIEDSGFTLDQANDLLKSNYFFVFRKKQKTTTRP